MPCVQGVALQWCFPAAKQGAFVAHLLNATAKGKGETVCPVCHKLCVFFLCRGTKKEACVYKGVRPTHCVRPKVWSDSPARPNNRALWHRVWIKVRPDHSCIYAAFIVYSSFTPGETPHPFFQQPVLGLKKKNKQKEGLTVVSLSPKSCWCRAAVFWEARFCIFRFAMLDSISANHNNKCLTFHSAWIEVQAVCRMMLSKQGEKKSMCSKQRVAKAWIYHLL